MISPAAGVEPASSHKAAFAVNRKRLIRNRRKIPSAAEIWSLSAPSGPVTIKVGSESEVGSEANIYASIKSSATLYYEDIESEPEAFKSVVEVGSEEEEAVPEVQREESSMHTGGVNLVPEEEVPGEPREAPPPTLNDNSSHFSFPRFILPPPNFPPPDLLLRPNPWLQAASANIEMTGWRPQAGFDHEEPPRPPDPGRGIPFPPLLTPEDLPRLHPGSLLPPPGFIRVEEEAENVEAKDCCARFGTPQSSFIRWFIGIISFIGLSCVIVGVVLGALTVSGTARLTLCALMIGVGIVLIMVSGIAWRLTTLDPTARPTVHNLFRLRSQHHRNIFPGGQTPYTRVRNSSRFPPPPGGIPPEFFWQPPPPSYQASVRETTLNMILESQRQQPPPQPPIGSPPPTYRSDSRASRPSLNEDIIERPPSYRSQRPPSEARAETPGAIANSNERIQINDQQELLRSPDTVSVIDCSSAVPVGFRVREQARRKPTHRPPPPPAFSHRRDFPGQVCFFPDPRRSDFSLRPSYV